jgi:hypothetical protein
MASGDLKYEEFVSGALTTQQRIDLVALIGQLWSGALGELQSVVFARNADNTVRYELRGEQTKAPGLVPIGSKITGRVP